MVKMTIDEEMRTAFELLRGSLRPRRKPEHYAGGCLYSSTKHVPEPLSDEAWENLKRRVGESDDRQNRS